MQSLLEIRLIFLLITLILPLPSNELSFNFLIMKEKEIQENMNKSIEATQRNFNTIRTGRANASLVRQSKC